MKRSFRFKIGCWASASLLLVVLASEAQAPPDQGLGDEEILRFSWSLGGFKGTLLRVVLPGRGDAVLRTGTNGSGHVISELRISSRQGRRGEYWRYGSEVDPQGGRALRAWTEQSFRGRIKEKSADLSDGEVLDIPSSIRRLRLSPPENPVFASIWSEGKIYPVRISGGELGQTRTAGGVIPTRTFSIEGVHRPNSRLWKGRLDLVLAQDEASTPVEIAMTQSGLKVRLKLVEPPPAS